jgi:alkylated DNA repair dioxygenase AlkB
MKKLLSPARSVIAAALIAGLAVPAQAQFREALDTGEQATRRAEQVQEQINQLDDQRSDMVREYRTLLQRRDAAELFAKQQELVVQSQREEIASLTEQLGSIDDITAQTVPMLLGMIEDLKLFVAADLPFKKEERAMRLEALDAVMAQPNVSTAEQYRLIMEAYSAEMEYGRTIDTWQEEITIDGNPTTVDMFLYGRVALVYLAPNGKAARYDRATGEWAPLPNSYADDVRQAIRVAQGKAQQVVLFAPVQKFSVQ